MIVKYRDSIEGLKLMKLPSFLKDVAWELELKINLSIDKFWIRENVRFEVTGEEDIIRKFKIIVYLTLKDFNNG